MKKVLQKQKGVGKHSRRIACLLLALVLTITGLPMIGGVETVQAYSYGRNSYGSLTNNGVLYVNGSGDADSAKLSSTDLERQIIPKAKTLSIGEKITSINGFGELTNLTTVEFNGSPDLGNNFLNGLADRNITILFSPNCTADFKNTVKHKFNQCTSYTFKEQKLVRIINSYGEPKDSNYKAEDTKTHFAFVSNNVYEKKYTSSDFGETGNDQITITISPKNQYSSKIEFDRWEITDKKKNTNVTGVTVAAITNPTQTGAATLTIENTMPSEVFVTAIYKQKGSTSIDLTKALEQVETELNAYGKNEDNYLDQVPSDVSSVQTGLESVLAYMKKMSGNMLTFTLSDLQRMGEVKAPTTSTTGALTYQYTLKVEDTFNTEAAEKVASKAGFTLNLHVKQKEDADYTVVVSRGLITGAANEAESSTGEFRKTYHLRDIEAADGNRISIPLQAENRSSSHYSFSNWTVESGGVTLSNANSPTTTLSLTEASPYLIRITANYNDVAPGTGSGDNPQPGGGETGGGGTSGGSTTETVEDKDKDKEKEEEKDKEKEEEKDTDKDKEEEKESEKPAPTQTATSKANSYQVTSTKTTATVSVKALKQQVAKNKNSKMVIKCGTSTATFDKTAVQSILAQAKKIGSSELKFVCKTGANSSLNSAQKKALKKKTVVGCYHVYLKCGDKLIKDFGKGKVTIKVPLKLKSGQKSKYVKLYYINSKGKLTKMTSSLAGSQLSYQTTHFSFFTALYAKPVTSTKETSTTTDTDKSQNTQTDKDTTGEKDTTTEKDTTGDKDTSTDQNEQAEKPSQEIGTENETLSGSSDLEERESLPKADSGEITAFCLLQLQPTRTNDTEIRLGWNPFPVADGYDLFGARCNTKTTRYELEQIASLDAPTMTSWMCENLKENTYYKFLVRAYKKVDGKKQYITRSTLIHVPTTGGRYDQIEGVSVNASEVKLSVGKTHAIKASLEVEKQNVRSHAIISYESADPAVASVDANGRIKAKKKGTCMIYVYAQNGLYTTVQVTVK
ncbi:MAG: fibronectin type III domain-containing protein [Lachnospiraceae bacterium]|nr:fibronectin type III domain-containing protein [Lachnospiraceae bacterium]